MNGEGSATDRVAWWSAAVIRTGPQPLVVWLIRTALRWYVCTVHIYIHTYIHTPYGVNIYIYGVGSHAEDGCATRVPCVATKDTRMTAHSPHEYGVMAPSGFAANGGPVWS